MKLLSLVFLIALSSFAVVHSLNSVALRDADILFNCSTVPYVNMPVCVALSKDDGCGMKVTFTSNGITLFTKHIDDIDTPVSGSVSSCNFELSAVATPLQRCLTVTPSCSGISIPAISIGCFDNTLLPQPCGTGNCPSNCNGNGRCNNGVCVCDSLHFGADCSTANTLYYRCQDVTIQSISTQVCMRLFFDNYNCAVGTLVQVSYAEFRVEVMNRTFEIANFRNDFVSGTIGSIGGICTAKINWDNLHLNDTYVSGCGNVSLECGPITPPTYDLGCFADPNVLPTCFLPCKNNCSNHGGCYHGQCRCDNPWKGDDCHTNDMCKSDCSTKGTCKLDGCHCNDGFEGDDCSTVSSVSSKPTFSGSSPATIIVVILVVVIVVAGVIAIAWFVIKKRKRTNAPQFTQLDLIQADEDDDLATTD